MLTLTPESPPQPHREKCDTTPLCILAMVTCPGRRDQVAQIPAAKKAVQAEWDTLRNKRCWMEETVSELSDVQGAAVREGRRSTSGASSAYVLKSTPSCRLTNGSTKVALSSRETTSRTRRDFQPSSQIKGVPRLTCRLLNFWMPSPCFLVITGNSPMLRRHTRRRCFGTVRTRVR